MTLGDYKSLPVTQPDLTVREEEIDNVLTREQRRHAVVVHTDDGKHILKDLEMQPLDDEFARDFSDCDTMDEWRGVIREQLEARREASANERICRELLAQIIANSDVPVDPDALQEISSILYEEFLDGLEASAVSLETWCSRSRMTEEDLYRSKEEEARFALQSEAVLREIAEREHLSVSPVELADELTAIAEEDDEDPAEFIDMLDDEDLAAISDDILLEKAMNFVLNHAVYVS